jgi:hypothetical protein
MTGTSIEAMIAYALAVARDDAHGYSQTNRTNAASPDMDCSRLVQLAVQAGGWPIGDGLFFTGNERARLEAIGWAWHPGTSGVQRGDILLRAGHHTAVYLGDGTRVEAWIDEAGDVVGRQPGDQDGQEIRIHTALDYPWDGYLRAPTAPTAQTATSDIEEIVTTMKATHIVFQVGGTVCVADVLAGTYRGMPSPATLRDTLNVLDKSGAKVMHWAQLGGNGSDKVSNPNAFGVKVR